MNEYNAKMNIAFSPPDISELEVEYVSEVLRSGWITTGPKTKLFEKKIAEWIGTPRCVCLNSQTACAEMALRLLQIGEGDEVITTAYTYTASASVIAHVGAKIVLVDCQKGSYEMDYDAMEEAITERTKAIIPVDYGGVPCDYDRIFRMAFFSRLSAELQLLQTVLTLLVHNGTAKWSAMLQTSRITVSTQLKT